MLVAQRAHRQTPGSYHMVSTFTEREGHNGDTPSQGQPRLVEYSTVKPCAAVWLLSVVCVLLALPCGLPPVPQLCTVGSNK